MSEDDAQAGSSERFFLLLEAAPDAILEVDREGRIVLANTQAQQLFRCTREELLGSTVEALVPERFRGKHLGYRGGYHAHPVTRPMGGGLDLYAMRRDGTEFAADINLSPFSGSEGLHVICVIRDVSERRAAEEKIRTINESLERRSSELAAANEQLSLRNREVERANQLKSEFLASMSHELRTPLNTILGFSELLSEQTAGSLNEKQKRFLTHIQHDAHHLLELINDILDLSKIEAGRLELRTERFPMAIAAAEVLTSVRPLAAAKAITLDSDLDMSLVLYADRMRFKEILYNLLSNAIKFTPPKGRIWIEAAAVDGTVRILVGDTGIGISPDDQEAIFDSFRQASATTKGVREGTGLGLAITKRLVELHNGTIGVESQPGQGSRFFFTLPLTSEEAIEQEIEPIAGLKRGSPLVLVTSHEALWRDETSRLLEREGLLTAAATSGGDALSKARSLRPNLILLDMELSGKSGWETLHELKVSPATSRIPVLVVSPMEERKMATAIGAAGFLMKPLSQPVLIEAVRKTLHSERTLQILVVDDDPETRQLIADVLADEGHTLRFARNASEALRILADIPVDAVILDLLLPGRSGFDLLGEIRATEKLRLLPVLILTVKDLTEGEHEMLAAQATAVLEKGSGWRPLLLDELRRLAQAGSGRKVLIADDNPAARELVSEGLRGHASTIIEASDGREALEKIRATRPHLVLLDIQMPEMDGYEVLRQIRLDPSLRGLRVVALTAFAMQGDRERALDAGFDDYITKPVSITKLKAQLEAAFPEGRL
jgi:PAS domain S-box-containing protein